MARHVIIQFPNLDEDHVRWVVAEDDGQLVDRPVEGTLSEAADAVEGRRATLLVAGDDVLLAEATVPGASAMRAQQAIPFALEEQLADDVDELHFALGPKDKGDVWPVAVLTRETMDRIAERCAAASLRPTEIVPEPLALPLAGGVTAGGGRGRNRAVKPAPVDGEAAANEPGRTLWSALLDGERAVVRLGRHRGFSGEADFVPLMLDGARRDLAADTMATLRLHRIRPESTLDVPAGVDLEIINCESALALYAAGLASAPRINLLQGDYSPKQKFDQAWKPWRWTAGLAACLAVVLFAGKWLDYRRLAEREAQIDAAIVETFERALPGTRLQRPVRQMQGALERIGAGGGDTFVLRTEQIAASLATQPQTTLRSIGYRDGRFDLDLTTDDLPTLDALKSELEARGSLGMTVQSANREDGAVRGRVRIE